MNSLDLVIRRVCFILFLLTPVDGPTVADDTGWLRAGTRVWWTGGTGGYDAEESSLIIGLSQNAATVVTFSASANWTLPMPPAWTRHTNPHQEGAFWISPHILHALKAPDAYIWNGLACVVASHDIRTLSTLPISGPTYLIEKLFETKPQRGIVALRAVSAASQFFFDEETGLMLSKTQGSSTFNISEINYDFSAQQGFPEDLGFHTGYKLSHIASHNVFGGDSQGVMIEARCFSRYRNSIQYMSQMDLMSTSAGSPINIMEMVIYDGETDSAYAQTITLQGIGPRYIQGTHSWAWLPPQDQSQSPITVRGLNLANRGGNPVLYTAESIPAGVTFPALMFNNLGFMLNFVITYPNYFSFYVDSSIDPNHSVSLEGYNYFVNSMGGPASGNVNEPTLNWTREAGFESDGVDPDSGPSGTTYAFRARYMSPAGVMPSNGYPRVHIYSNSIELATSPFTMTALDDGAVTTGRTYGCSLLLAPGSNYSYRMQCYADNGLMAVGSAMGFHLGPDVETSSADADNDGVSDAWEWAWFGNLTNVTATSDCDDDRFPDWLESLAGTCPTNNQSFLGLQATPSPPNSDGIIIRWQSVTGKYYSVGRTTNLVSPGDGFISTHQHISGQPTSTEVTDTTANADGTFIYRVNVE